jgi:hypothetical protein
MARRCLALAGDCPLDDLRLAPELLDRTQHDKVLQRVARDRWIQIRPVFRHLDRVSAAGSQASKPAARSSAISFFGDTMGKIQ